MRAIGWICVGFFVYYVVEQGGVIQALHNISGEIHSATSSKPIDIDMDDIKKPIQDLRKQLNLD